MTRSLILSKKNNPLVNLNYPSAIFGLLCAFICIPNAFAGEPEEDDEDLESLFDESSLEMEEEEEEEENQESVEGGDSAIIYQEFEQKVKGLEPEEELIEWRKYLNRYPNSVFKQRINQRMDLLEENLFDEDILETVNQDTAKESGLEELYFAQPMYLENIDPRTKTRFAFALGLPSYFNLLIDHEHQINRDLSVHGGVRQRYTGWNLELGAKYSFIKSKRTNTLLTGIMDLRLNASPGFPALRPQIAYGRRFDLPKDFRLDAQAQLGSDIVIWNGLDPRIIGGINLTFVPTDNVRIYMEGSVYMKDFLVSSEQGLPIDPFAFNTLTFGLKFLDRKGKSSKEPDNQEVGLGTNVPYYYKYYRNHFGAILGDVNFYHNDSK
jgi:hypothetical protein